MVGGSSPLSNWMGPELEDSNPLRLFFLLNSSVLLGKPFPALLPRALTALQINEACRPTRGQFPELPPLLLLTWKYSRSHFNNALLLDPRNLTRDDDDDEDPSIPSKLSSCWPSKLLCCELVGDAIETVVVAISNPFPKSFFPNFVMPQCGNRYHRQSPPTSYSPMSRANSILQKASCRWLNFYELKIAPGVISTRNWRLDDAEGLCKLRDGDEKVTVVAASRCGPQNHQREGRQLLRK